MGWLKILRNLKDIGGKIVEIKDKVTQDVKVDPDTKVVPVVQDVVLNTFYQKYKAVIWGTVWALASWVGSSYVNDAVDGLPVVKEMDARVTQVEQRVIVVENDLKEIKEVLTPK